MPWKVEPLSELRLALVHSVRVAGQCVAEAARRFGVSRKTAYKWLKRYDAQPATPMICRSRRPHHSPGRTADSLEQLVLEARQRWGWGPRKLHAVLLREGHKPPPIRTIAAILRRHGCIQPPAPTPRMPSERFERADPNQLWQLDFKGPLEVDRQRVLPLSVLDDHSRYLLALRPCTDMTFQTVQAVLWELFGDVGLPEAMLCDNAFAAKNSGVGLSSFDGWLVRLGIKPVHGRPYHPQTQGKVERFHGTLERELWAKVRRDSLTHFAADLESWRPIYNTIRPHEALDDQPPVSRWRPSSRTRPAQMPEVVYPKDALVRTVCSTGTVRYRSCRITVGRGLAGERVRIEEASGEVKLYYCDHRVRCLSSSQLNSDRVL